MNCDECDHLLSGFMDNELEETQAAAVREHLAFCDKCAKVCEELAAIVDLCRSEAPNAAVSPNSKALWCRINNIIESEVKPDQVPLPKIEEPRRRFWLFSLPQLAAAVVCIALISSLLTVVAIRNYKRPADDFTSRSAESQTTIERVMAKVGLIETPQQARDRHTAEQKAAIEYWNRHVQQRRAQWDARMRDAFDRNLNVLNDSVNEYTLILQQNPDDEITGEMLDSALDEKMSLLREFAEL
jgi:anti-sigma factor RsiW